VCVCGGGVRHARKIIAARSVACAQSDDPDEATVVTITSRDSIRNPPSFVATPK
jgi:hypothetical protein